MPEATGRKRDVIQIRTTAEAKVVLNRAAALRGQSLSDFVMESATRAAEDAILDQRLFVLDDDAHRRLIALLDEPPPLSAEARARLTRKAPWEG
jgi:uncharacterized protein (DUF1778 family)